MIFKRIYLLFIYLILRELFISNNYLFKIEFIYLLIYF